MGESGPTTNRPLKVTRSFDIGITLVSNLYICVKIEKGGVGEGVSARGDVLSPAQEYPLLNLSYERIHV